MKRNVKAHVKSGRFAIIPLKEYELYLHLVELVCDFTDLAPQRFVISGSVHEIAVCKIFVDSANAITNHIVDFIDADSGEHINCKLCQFIGKNRVE